MGAGGVRYGLTGLVAGFLAGFLAVLTAHQAVIAAGGALGLLPGATGWSMRPVPPLGIPQVLSLAFWGGVWGIPLAWLAGRMEGGWLRWAVPAVIFGLATTLVGWYVVGPLKGRPPVDFSVARLTTGLVINGAWALGALAILALLRRFGR